MRVNRVLIVHNRPLGLMVSVVTLLTECSPNWWASIG